MKAFLRKTAVMALAVITSAALSDLSVTAETADPAAENCGGDHSIGTIWTGDAFAADGSYYLNSEVVLSSQIEIDKDVTLCLKGNKLSMAKGTEARIFYIKDGGSLTLCDCTGDGLITGGNLTSEGGGAVYVESGATLIINEGTISGNKVSGSNDGGAVFSKGTFTMNGGTITGNAARNGGGININDGVFTMNGGTVSDNTVTIDLDGKNGTGGGVFLYKNGKFIMTGGVIKDNTAGGNGGGVYVHEGSVKFEFIDGTISGNTAEHEGGGVYVCSALKDDPCGEFEMKGGTISGNTAKANIKNVNGGGGGVYTAGNFVMNGGTISGNNAGNENELHYGGGVCVSSGGTFTMKKGSTISGNTAKYGGGVYVNKGTFNMEDGTIGGANNASDGGGGVCLGSGAFTMTGGLISDNTSKYGGGVHFVDGTMTLDKHVNIMSNERAGIADSESNVYLRTGKRITIGKDFSTDHKIGIHPQTPPDCINYIDATVFAADAAVVDISDNFKADITEQSILYEDSMVKLRGPHKGKKTEAVPPTCTENGVKEYWTCSVCSKMFDDSKYTTEITSLKAIPATGHRYGVWIVTKEPTYTSTGIATRTCANDPSHILTEIIPMLSDSPDDSSESSIGDDSSDESSESSSSDNSSESSNSGFVEITPNPPTGIMISLVPLTAAITALTVTIMRKKK